MPDDTQTISACLIVRDEEATLDGCLRSLQSVVGDIVLVDTGSVDRTLEIAREYSVSLYQSDWPDDFSVARNYALERAQGDWILSIDADERLDVPPDFDVTDLLADDSVSGFRLRLRQTEGYTPYGALRLWRNDPRIRFRGCIHEQVRDAVQCVSDFEHTFVRCCSLSIRHLGHDEENASKNERYKSLLQKELKANPDRAYCWWHLGKIAAENGDRKGAEAAWLGGIAAVRRRKSRRTELPDSMPFVALIDQKVEYGEDPSALVAEARQLFPSQLAIQLCDANLTVRKGSPNEAVGVLERLSAIDPDEFYDPDIWYKKSLFSYHAREGLGLCYFRLGRYEDAARQFKLAAAAADDDEASLIMARLAEAKAQHDGLSTKCSGGR